MENQLPPEIAELIEKALQDRAAARAERAAKEEQERAAAEEKGRLLVEAHYQEILANVPEWIREYHNPKQDHDFYRIGKGWNRVDDIYLVFDVPGLSRLLYCIRKTEWVWESALLDWRKDNPELNFYNSPAYLELADAAIQAREEWLKFEAAKVEQQKILEKRAEDHENWEAMQRETANRQEAMKAERAAADLSEEQALLDVLKNDPVALSMLKAFVHLRQEREGFEAELENANSGLLSMEEGWSRKAAELRNRAQEAERRADEERRRLEGELDDERRKQKKAERGW